MKIKSSSPFTSAHAALHLIAGYMFVRIVQSGQYVFLLNGDIYVADLEAGTYQLPTQHDEDDWVVGWQDAIKFPFLPKSIANGIKELETKESTLIICDSKEGWVDAVLIEEEGLQLVFDAEEGEIHLTCTKQDIESLKNGYGVRLYDDNGKQWELWKEQTKVRRRRRR